MVAYAVSARISDVRPYRTSRREQVADAWSRVTDAGRLPCEALAVEFDGHEARGVSWSELIVGWTETTFYLFDPQSWR